MAEATGSLLATLDMDEVLDRPSTLCVPAAGRLGPTSPWSTGTGPCARPPSATAMAGEAELEQLIALQTAHLPAGSPARRSLATFARSCSSRSPTRRSRSCSTRVAAGLFRDLGGSSLLTVPMVARRRMLGAMGLVSASADRTFTPEDADLVEDLARRAALALDNVRLYQQEHAVADTLQRSLLPDLPAVPGITAAAHYVSASTAADVGGDFYDLLALPDGRSAWSSVTSSATTSPPRPRWATCGTHPRLPLGRRGSRPGARARPGGPPRAGPAGRVDGDDGLRPRDPTGGRRRSVAAAGRQRRSPAPAAATS